MSASVFLNLCGWGFAVVLTLLWLSDESAWWDVRLWIEHSTEDYLVSALGQGQGKAPMQNPIQEKP